MLDRRIKVILRVEWSIYCTDWHQWCGSSRGSKLIFHSQGRMHSFGPVNKINKFPYTCFTTHKPFTRKIQARCLVGYAFRELGKKTSERKIVIFYGRCFLFKNSTFSIIIIWTTKSAKVYQWQTMPNFNTKSDEISEKNIDITQEWNHLYSFGMDLS